MDGKAPTLSEAAVRGAWDAGDMHTAASLALQLFNSEILSFLVWRLRAESDGREAFSMFAEDLWSGLPSFEWRCSVRTWMYALARNAAHRYAASGHRRFEHQFTDTINHQLDAIAQSSRTRTQLHQRSEIKARVRALRDNLDPDDQMLLVLRVDRGLSWRDLALALSGETVFDDETLLRESARLRQAFQRIKSELRRLARQQGLIATDSP